MLCHHLEHYSKKFNYVLLVFIILQEIYYTGLTVL